MVNGISGAYNSNSLSAGSDSYFTDLLANLSNNTQTLNSVSSQYTLSMPLNASSPAAIANFTAAINNILPALNSLTAATTDPTMLNILNNTLTLCNTFTSDLNNPQGGESMISPPLNFVIQALNSCCSYGASYNGNKSISNTDIVPLSLPAPPPTMNQLCDSVWDNMNPPNFQNCETPLTSTFSSAILTLMQQSLTLPTSDFSFFLKNNFQTYPAGFPSASNSTGETWNHSFLGALIANYSLYSPDPSNISMIDLGNIDSLLVFGIALGPNPNSSGQETNTGYGGFPGTSTTTIPPLT